MRWAARFALSLGCALAADLIVCFFNQFGYDFIGFQGLHWYGVFTLAFITLFLVVPGWLLFLILVFAIPHPHGWGLALFAVLGCLIGPGFLFASRLHAVVVHTWDSLPPLDGTDAGAAAISALTTLLYLSLLTLLARNRITTS